MKRPAKKLTYNFYGERHIRRPKYSNRSATCWQKHIHQSIAEADYCNELGLLRRAGQIGNYETQHKIDLKVNGKHICNHYVDFIVFKAGGIIEYHEVKGYPTEVWKIKRKLVEALYPKIAYIVNTEKSKWNPGLK